MTSLDDYRRQREFRELVRKKYLVQFEKIRGGSITINSKNSQADRKTQSHPQSHREDHQRNLLQQNTFLKQQLSLIQQQQQQILVTSRQKIQQAKSTYINRLKALTQKSTHLRKQLSQKTKTMEQNIKQAESKSNEIEETNARIEKEWEQDEKQMQQNISSMSKQYDEKLTQFGQILQNSTNKIGALQQQYNQQQLVQSTLGNEQQLYAISQNAINIQPEIDNLLSRYTQLQTGRDQIIQQLRKNNEVKQAEIGKMGALEDRMRDIFGRMETEMGMYSRENSKMSQELGQVKQLLEKVLGGEK